MKHVMARSLCRGSSGDGSQPINDRSPINTGIVHFTSGKIQPSETFQGFLMYDQIIFQRLIQAVKATSIRAKEPSKHKMSN